MVSKFVRRTLVDIVRGGILLVLSSAANRAVKESASNTLEAFFMGIRRLRLRNL